MTHHSQRIPASLTGECNHPQEQYRSENPFNARNIDEAATPSSQQLRQFRKRRSSPSRTLASGLILGCRGRRPPPPLIPILSSLDDDDGDVPAQPLAPISPSSPIPDTKDPFASRYTNMTHEPACLIDSNSHSHGDEVTVRLSPGIGCDRFVSSDDEDLASIKSTAETYPKGRK